MSQVTSDYVSKVNDVISICKDAQEGFSGAANAVGDPTLKALFNEYSRQRERFAAQLEAGVRRLNGDPAEPSGVAGKAHSAWMAIKGMLTGHSSHQILEETERGEDMSVKRYQDALSGDVPAELRTILEQQYQEVRTAHDRIRGLRDSYAHK